MARYAGYSQLQGLIVPDERFNTDNLRINDGGAGNSSYTESGPRPGQPVYDLAEVAATSPTAGNLGPSVSLETTGDQAAVDYHIKVLKGGMPGRDMEVVYRDGLAGTDTWRGWQTHNVAEWHPVEVSFDRGVAPAGVIVNYSSCPTADGQVLFVAAGTNAGTTQVFCRRFNPKTHTTSAVVTIADDETGMNTDTGTFAVSASYPLVEAILLPTGRILVYALAQEIHTGGAGNTTLWVFFSDDDGATWRSGNYLAIDTLIDAGAVTPVKMRAVYSRESVLLVVSTDDGQAVYKFQQFASDDTGYNFILVEDSVLAGRHHDVVVDEASGIITFLYYTGTEVHFRRIASPFVPLSSALDQTLSTDDPTHLVAYGDTDGTLYVTYDVTEDIDHYYSRDGGASWTKYQSNVIDTGHASNNIDAWDITAQHGRAIWLIADTGGNLTDHLFLVMESGGWNTLLQPREGGIDPTENSGFGSDLVESQMFFPFRLPTSYNWTNNGAGAASTNGVAPYGVTITTIGTSRYFSRTPAGSVTRGTTEFWSLKVDSGGSLTTTDIGVEVTLGDGAQDYRIAVRFSGAGVRVYDFNAAAEVATAAVDTLTQRRTFKLALRPNRTATAAKLSLYWRASDGDEWTTAISSAAIVKRVVGPSATNLIQWGHIDASDAVSQWQLFHYTMCSGAGYGTAGQPQWVDDLSQDLLAKAPYALYGRRVPAPPYRAWLDQGLYLHATGGPAVRGDTWSISREHDYPVEHHDVHSYPSPARPWRSVGTGAVRFAWEPDDNGYNSHPGTALYGPSMFGCNFPTCLFRGWTGAAWTTLVDVRFHGEMTGRAFTRDGNVVSVDTAVGGTGAKYIGYDELAGCTVKLDSGAGNIKYRKVLHNTEGSWTNQDTKRPILTLDGVDGTEPVSGTLDIWYREAVALVANDLTEYSRYAIEIPAGTTVDGYYEIGALAIGAVAVFGHKYSRNRTVETIPNYDLYTGRSGQRSARRLGLARRLVEASWVEGYDATEVQQTNPVPGYVSVSAASTALAARGDAYLLEGVLRRVDGASTPVVYLPKIAASGDPLVVREAGREACILGRLVSSVTREVVLGEENASEVVRVAGFRLEEEV